MRTINEWTQDDLRITILHHNDKYTLKIESGLLEQNYKLRDGQMDMAKVNNHLDQNFVYAIKSIFSRMDNAKTNLLSKSEDLEDFPEII